MVQLGMVDPGGQAHSGGPSGWGTHTVPSGQGSIEQMPKMGKRKRPPPLHGQIHSGLV